MRASGIRMRPELPLLALALTWLGGCVEYTIETTVRPDGSGVRVERMDAQEDENVSVTSGDFTELMAVSGARGWTHRRDVSDEGDSIHVFERRRDIPGLDAWADLTGQVRIAGAPRRASETRVGYVTLGDVGFSNQVLVVTGMGSDGSRAYTYRETFSWDNAVDVLVEFFMERVDRTLGARYPTLSGRERGEIVGFARARLWHAMDAGLIGAADSLETRLISQVIDHTVRHGLKIVRLRYPDEGPDFLQRALNQLYEGSDEWLEEILENQVPGLNLAFNTGIEFRLTMPGRVTDTNAHRRDGNTLVWEFGPTDAMPGDIQVFARSVVEGMQLNR
jgi:hypothetical protein